MTPRKSPMRTVRRATPRFACLALGLLLALPAIADDAPPRSKATFAMVWEKLRESTFDDSGKDIDWAALEAGHRPRIERTSDLPTQRREIAALLDAIGVSHLSLIPAEAVPEADEDDWAPDGDDDDDGRAADGADLDDDGSAKDGAASDAADSEDETERPRAAPKTATIGMRVALVDGALRAIRIQPDSAAAAAGLRPGQEILRIDGVDMTRALRNLALQPSGRVRQRAEQQLQMQLDMHLNDLPSGTTVALSVRGHDGATKALTLTAKRKRGARVELMPGMPAQIMFYEAQRLDAKAGGCVLRVQFDMWAQPAFDRLAETLRKESDCDRLILDLRGNPGGHLWTLSAIGGLFFEHPTSLGNMRTQSGMLKLAVLPRRVALDGSLLRRLQGPLAILIDRGSASSSEIFAAGMQALGRARVFGETSAGMALPAMTVRLPSGDWLYYPTADMTDPNERSIEGVGVTPDQAIAMTAGSLAAGEDAVLDAALAWVSTAPSPPAPSAAPAPVATGADGAGSPRR